MDEKPYKIIVAHHMPTDEAYVPPPDISKETKTKFERGFYSKETFDIFMYYAAAYTDKYGFAPSKGKETPTANRAWNAAFSHQKKPIKIKKRHVSRTIDALNWASALTDKEIEGNTYLGKIRNIAKGKYLNSETCNHAASIINAYHKRVLSPTPNKSDDDITEPAAPKARKCPHDNGTIHFGESPCNADCHKGGPHDRGASCDGPGCIPRKEKDATAKCCNKPLGMCDCRNEGYAG